MAEATAQIRVPVERTAPDTIRLERILDAPLETVWRYLTDAELRSQWFMGGSDAAPGGEFDLVIDHDKLSADQNVPYPDSYASAKGKTWKERVLRFEPPRLLATTFQGGETVLTHSGIVTPVGPQDFGSGWNSHLTVLEEKLAGRSVGNFWELHARSREQVRNVLDG